MERIKISWCDRYKEQAYRDRLGRRKYRREWAALQNPIKGVD